MLLDSNIIIYAFEPDYPEVERFLETGHFAVSSISQLEVMGYWRLSAAEYQRFEAFFGELDILPVTDAVIARAVSLRRQRSLGLADAVIAATALLNGLPLVTHNTEDFKWIEGLQLIDPMSDK
ncbi:type II toxin-antitoxin system VapC family toxin [Methylomagnum sp.]